MVLRHAALGLGLLLAAGAVLGLVLGAGAAVLPFGVFGALLLAGALFERPAYGPIAETPPDAPFLPTGERFRDPASGVVVEVWHDAATGRRRYAQARPAAPPG